MKICLVSPPGGHLTQLLLLREAVEDYDFFFITYRDERTARLSPAYLLPHLWKEPHSILLLLPLILRILIRERPRVVLSTGGEIAIPVFVLGRFLRAKTIFVESLARVETRSLTGRLLYPISNVFLVQSPRLLPMCGKRARYWGNLL